MTVREAVDEMAKHSFDQFPVKGADGNIIGCITSNHLTTRLMKKKTTMDDTLEKNVTKEYRNVSSGITLTELGRIFTRHSFVLVDNQYIISNHDLLKFMKDKF